MSAEWYLMGSAPVYNSGYEKEEFEMFAKDSFSEILETSPISKNIKIINHDLSLIKDISAIVANNIADSESKSKERYLLTVIGTLSCGDYISYENNTWLIISFIGNNGVYEKAIMQLCNYTIKFQSPNGTILSYPCITSNKTFSENANQTVISLGENKKSILLPFNENTSLLPVGKRMYVDKRTNPTPYRIIGDIDTTTYNYGDKGLIYFIMEQDLIENNSQYPDRPDLGICNYFESTTSPPLLPESEKYSVITSSNVNNQITIGSISGRTLTPKFYKDDIEVTDIIAVWSYELPVGYENQFTITSVVGTNKVKIVAKDNTSLVGKTVTAIVSDELGEYKSSISLTVISGF